MVTCITYMYVYMALPTLTRTAIALLLSPPQGAWRVAPIPPVMLDRRVDVGDVSPDDAKSLVEALNCGAQVIW